jgi:hypothetical protein
LVAWPGAAPVPFLLVHEEQPGPPDNVVTGVLATLNDVIAVRESVAGRDRSSPGSASE